MSPIWSGPDTIVARWRHGWWMGCWIERASTCTVFAESEIIAQMSREAPKADIVAGIHAAIASRVAGLAGQVGLEEAMVMTGGVAQNIGVARALERQIGLPIVLPSEPQLVGALGAALLAREKEK